MTTITIALDAMGGDFGPTVVVPAALEALERNKNLRLILVGDEDVLQPMISRPNQRLEIHHAPDVVAMNELPSSALRNKKQSSMRLAINLVKEGKAQACVSAGNTGALMATARFVLKTLPGIDRPAIISELPTRKGQVHILDLGANVDSRAENLCQFAIMGSIISSVLDKIPNPRVGLLNIGSEEIKGNEQVKQTAQMLNNIKSINYIGYVEGDSMFQDVADVIVCDGFIGNVALKTTEGTASLMMHYMKEAFQNDLYSRIVSFITKPIIHRLKKRMDPSRYNGASFVGLHGIVVKSHGGANILGFRHAIEQAVVEVNHNVPELISDKVAELMDEGELL